MDFEPFKPDAIYLAILLVAYLSGSISTAILTCRLLTLPDPRQFGSHNPGATNVRRIAGNRAALATLLGDVAKTALPMYLALYLGYLMPQVAWVGVSALLGHCFPIYYRFQGGKGVASLLTVILVITPQLSFLSVFTWLLAAWTFRRSSVASLLTSFMVPVFAYRFYPEGFIPLTSLSLLVFVRHSGNIANIMRGNEPLIGQKALFKVKVSKHPEQQNPGM